MKKGDLLMPSEEAREQQIANKLRNCVCLSKPDIEDIITVEHDDIRKPEKRYRSRYHKSFFKVKP